MGEEQECWREIVDFPDYEISNLGRVRRARAARSSSIGRILRGTRHNTGYQQVLLSRDGKVTPRYVHRLVATAFLPIDPDRREVNHKNSNRADSRAVNLEWVTRSENVRHMYGAGRRCCAGEENGKARLNDDMVREIRSEDWSIARGRLLADRFGVSLAAIRDVHLGRRWAHVSEAA